MRKGAVILLLISLLLISVASAENKGEHHTLKEYEQDKFGLTIEPLLNTWNGETWEPTNTNLTTNGCEYDYCSQSPHYQADFYANPTLDDAIKTTHEGHTIYYTPEKLQWIGEGRQSLINEPINNGIQIDENVVTYPDLYGTGLSLTYTYRPSLLKEQLLIQSFSDLPPPAANLGENPELELEFRIRTDMDIVRGSRDVWNRVEDLSTQEALAIKHFNDTVFELPRPTATDAAGNTIPLTYHLRARGANLFISVTTPYEWLANATYPVKIDPTTSLEVNTSEITVDIDWNITDVEPVERIVVHNATEGTLRIDTGVERYAIDPTNMTFSYAEISIAESHGDLLFKCAEWNFDTRTCGNETHETWTEIQGLTPGQPYEVLIYAADPAFSEYVYDDEEESSASTSYVTKLNQDVNLSESGNYLSLVSADFSGTSTGYSIYAQILFNDELSEEVVTEPNDPAPSREYINILGHRISYYPSGTYNFKTQYRTENSAMTVFTKNHRVNMIKVDEHYYDNQTAIFELTDTYVTYANITFTPNQTQEYLVMATGDYSSTSTTSSVSARLLIDGEEVAEFTQEAKDTNDFHRFFTHITDSFDTSNHTVELQLLEESPGGEAKNLALSAIALTTDYDHHYDENQPSTTVSNPGTQYEKASLTLNPDLAGEYTFIATLIGNSQSLTNSIQFNLTIDGETVCSGAREPKDLTDYIPLGCIERAYIDGATQAILYTSKKETGTVTVSDIALTAFRSTPTCTENWELQTETIGTCQTNNTRVSTRTYTDVYECGTTNDLPSNKGTVEEYCNYCTPDWVRTQGPCTINNTRFIEYVDNNYCYALTGLVEDAPPVDQQTNETCTYLLNQFNCDLSDDPYLKKKISYQCTLPAGYTWSCVNKILHADGDLVQVNPQRTERVQGGLINLRTDLESRETFTASNGLLNAYYTNENLLTETIFIVTTTCTADNNTIQNQALITPIYRDAGRVGNQAVWVKENLAYLVVAFLILVIIAMLLGSLWRNLRR